MTTLRPSLSVLLMLAACAPKEQGSPADSAATQAVTPSAPIEPVKVASIDGFSTPESVLWDAEQRVWFVSNINGAPSAKDGNGFISRLTADGQVENLRFVESGRDGVLLNGPKGMTLHGDTLWVADIDALRGFDRRTGAPLATLEFGVGAKFLNDVVVGPDGTIYVTDSGLIIGPDGLTHPGPDRVFAVKGGAVSIAAEGAWLAGPNGITWDHAHGRFIIVPFSGGAIIGWKPGEPGADTLGVGAGAQDGVVIMDGQTYVTSWADSTLFVMGPDGNRKVVTGINGPADIGMDPDRGHIGIPHFLGNKVEIWKMR